MLRINNDSESFKKAILYIVRVWAYCCIISTCISSPVILLGQEQAKPDVLQPDTLPIIIPDRPGIGDYSGTVGKGLVQLECGFGIVWGLPNVLGNVTNRLFYPNLLIRYGLLDNFELRCMIEYDHYSSKEFNENTDIIGFYPLDIGIKTTICQEGSIYPQIGLLTKCILPFWGKPEFRPQNIAPSVMMIFDKTLSPLFSININTGLIWNGNSPEATGVATFNLDITPIDNLTFFVEVYGFFPEKQEWGLGINAGAVYPITNNLQVDISGGRRLFGNVDAGFVTTGVSWRLPQ